MKMIMQTTKKNLKSFLFGFFVFTRTHKLRNYKFLQIFAFVLNPDKAIIFGIFQSLLRAKSESGTYMIFTPKSMLQNSEHKLRRTHKLRNYKFLQICAFLLNPGKAIILEIFHSLLRAKSESSAYMLFTPKSMLLNSEYKLSSFNSAKNQLK